MASKVARLIKKLRQVRTDAGMSTVLAQEATWSEEGGVTLTHIINFHGQPPEEDRIYLSPDEMNALTAWWQENKKES